MKKIKVVHVANIDVGLKVHLGNYMQYLRDQGYCVSAITHPGEWLPYDSTIFGDIFVKIIRFKPKISPLDDLKTFWQLVKYFRQEQFDIVHTHTVKPGLLGRLAARMTRVPVIIHTVHGFYSYEGMSPAQNYLYETIEKLGSASCDLLLSQNKQDIETAIAKKIAPPEKIHFLGNGIDLNRFDPARILPEKTDALRLNLGISSQDAVIGFIARLEREKGIYEFIEAASILKSKGIKARYLIAGSPQKNKATAVSPQEILHKYGLDEDILLLGYWEDVAGLFSLLDILVFPSHGREGVPRIVMESASFGLPVVATRVRGVIEAVEDGVTGILVEPRDSAALAAGMLTFLENPDMAAEMGRKARLRSRTHFDERRFFWRTDIEYRRLLNEKLEINADSMLKPVPSAAA